MLQTQSVNAPTLELLKQLMAFEALANFNLVGETALALQFGHRISVDLDLFTVKPFNHKDLEDNFNQKFGKENIKINISKSHTILLKINDIKVDTLHYPYDLIDDISIIDNIRICSLKDIAAMKLSAISKRGAKKDFFDVYELLQEQFSLREMFGFYKQKFENHELGFIARSLLYFDDAELDPDPIMIKNYNWDVVKKEISKQVEKLIL